MIVWELYVTPLRQHLTLNTCILCEYCNFKISYLPAPSFSSPSSALGFALDSLFHRQQLIWECPLQEFLLLHMLFWTYLQDQSDDLIWFPELHFYPTTTGFSGSLLSQDLYMLRCTVERYQGPVPRILSTIHQYHLDYAQQFLRGLQYFCQLSNLRIPWTSGYLHQSQTCANSLTERRFLTLEVTAESDVDIGSEGFWKSLYQG